MAATYDVSAHCTRSVSNTDLARHAYDATRYLGRFRELANGIISSAGKSAVGKGASSDELGWVLATKTLYDRFSGTGWECTYDFYYVLTLSGKIKNLCAKKEIENGARDEELRAWHAYDLLTETSSSNELYATKHTDEEARALYSLSQIVIEFDYAGHWRTELPAGEKGVHISDGTCVSSAVYDCGNGRMPGSPFRTCLDLRFSNTGYGLLCALEQLAEHPGSPVDLRDLSPQRQREKDPAYQRAQERKRLEDRRRKTAKISFFVGLLVLLADFIFYLLQSMQGMAAMTSPLFFCSCDCGLRYDGQLEEVRLSGRARLGCLRWRRGGPCRRRRCGGRRCRISGLSLYGVSSHRIW